MREKQRFLVYRWRKHQKLSLNELEDLVLKEIRRHYGDFGTSLCGPRFKIFALGDQGVAVKVRFEALKLLVQVFKEFSSLQLIHVAGSASLVKTAIAKKLPKVVVSDSGIW